MQTAEKRFDLDFTYLPAFAQFLLDHRVDDMVQEQMRISRQLNLSLLKYFESMPEAEFVAFAKKSATEFLAYIANNKAREQIEHARQRWLSDQLPRVTRHQILAQDIATVSFIRKQALLKFIPVFTSDMQHMLSLVREIDEYVLESERTFSETFVTLQAEREQQNTTERMEMEREAREGQHFIQKIADATPSIIASYNINTGKYRFVSMGLNKLLGYDPRQPMEDGVQFFVDIVHPDDLAGIMEKNAAAVQVANDPGNSSIGEPIIEFEYRMRHFNGEYRWFHTFGTVFDRNAQGHVEHVLNISIDITDRKEMEMALSHMNMQLKQSNSNLEEFAYVTSHDLKEPLRKISIFGDRLLSTHYQQLGTEGQLFLEKIIDAARRMQVLINDLLSLSLIAGNQALVKYSLQTVLEEALQTLEHEIEEKQVIIQHQSLPEARIIPAQFRQLFQNLLSNSMKFVREGVRPEINIYWNWASAKEAEQYKLVKAKSYLQVSFADNGIGFDNIFAAKIFAIFQRLHHKTYEGTGIGLAICKKIVENHGGVIFARGEPGQGATFTFIIPV